MRNKIAIPILLMILILSVNVAFAGNNIVTFAPGYRYVMPESDYDGKMALNDPFGMIGANVGYKYYFHEKFSGQLRGGYWYGELIQEYDDLDITVKTKNTLVPLTIGLNYEIMPDRLLNPYVGAGIGFDYIGVRLKTEKDNGKSNSEPYDTINFAGYMVVGFDLLLTEGFGMGLDLSYNYAPMVALDETEDFPGQNINFHNVAMLINFNFAF